MQLSLCQACRWRIWSWRVIRKGHCLMPRLIGVGRHGGTVAGRLEDGADGWELSRMELQVLCWKR